jgi:hypothetical protein
MEPLGPKFGGGVTENLLHPVVLVAMLVAMVLVFTLPRKYVIVPVLVTTFLIPEGQQFYVLGVHLFVYRLVILAAFIRAMRFKARKKRVGFAGGWNSIDTAFTWFAVISAVATMVLYPTFEALINQAGYLWDYLLGYLLLRMLIRDEEDSLLVIKCFSGLMVLLGAAMVVEAMGMGNIFALLGGVKGVSEVRGTQIRAQAVFQHALTAGAFAAPAIPLYFILWRQAKARYFAVAGIAAATVMTFATQTSTSLVTLMAGIAAVFVWPLRKRMKTVRIGVVGALLGMALVMKAPVWFVLAHIDLTGSSSSYHRAALIDQFVNHFSSWWLVGTKDAATWGVDMWDAQNMFVSVGEAGGLAALVFFILVVSRSFAKVGNARKRATSKNQEWLLWLLGSALFANIVGFFGVNYFDQSKMAYFALISMICACTLPKPATDFNPKPAKVEASLAGDEALPAGNESLEAPLLVHRSIGRHLTA